MSLSLCELKNLGEVSIDVGQSGNVPRNHHGVQGVTSVNVLVNFYPIIDENQRGLTGDANSGSNHHGLGFWRCSTIADVPGASAHQLLLF